MNFSGKGEPKCTNKLIIRPSFNLLDSLLQEKSSREVQEEQKRSSSSSGRGDPVPAAEEIQFQQQQQRRSSSRTATAGDRAEEESSSSAGSRRSQQQSIGAEGLQEVAAPGQVQAGQVQSLHWLLSTWLPGPGPCIGAVGCVIKVCKGERQRQVLTKTLKSEICDQYDHKVMVSVITN
jgi:hypothetical protein